MCCSPVATHAALGPTTALGLPALQTLAVLLTLFSAPIATSPTSACPLTCRQCSDCGCGHTQPGRMQRANPGNTWLRAWHPCMSLSGNQQRGLSTGPAASIPTRAGGKLDEAGLALALPPAPPFRRHDPIGRKRPPGSEGGPPNSRYFSPCSRSRSLHRLIRVCRGQGRSPPHRSDPCPAAAASTAGSPARP